MQFYVFMNIIKKMESEKKFVSSTVYYDQCSTLSIVYIP